MTHRKGRCAPRRIIPIAALPALATAIIYLLVLAVTPSPSRGQSLQATSTASSHVDFQQVELIFKEHCESCHGAGTQMGGLRLDRREDAFRGGKSGAVILPGHSTGSRMFRLVAGQVEGLRMPLGGAPLSDQDIELLRNWIDQGAVWPSSGAPEMGHAQTPTSTHWAFQPIAKSTPPPVRNVSWVRNEIDSFVLAKLEKENIQPSPAADKATLARRLSLDITGLPISPEDLQEFLADGRADAYERLVDRLLESPHYGEKWGRYWLDLARYADSDGYGADQFRKTSWRYRDWVVQAFNRDMPFDRFTIDQIAGDLLPNATAEERVATGFHRNSLFDQEAGVDVDQTLFEQNVDRTNAVGAVWLGLTVECARCHNHKFDPITQKDYYSLFAFFEHVRDVDVDAPLPGEMGPYLRNRSEYLKKREALFTEYKVRDLQAEWEKKLIEASKEPGKYADWDFVWTQLSVVDVNHEVTQKTPSQRTAREREYMTDIFLRFYKFEATQQLYEAHHIKELNEKLKQLNATYPGLTQAMAVEDRQEDRKTNIRLRGDYKARGDEVWAATPAFLPPIHSSGTPDRLALARWLVSPENPLTARVMVNRVWQELFGRGIVATSENFGTQGDKPSHPELLDWLAVAFRDNGWSVKQLIRYIVTSQTYRQSSLPRPDLEDRDPNNLLLARQGRIRLPAELIRDSALEVSGLLNPEMGGPTIRPPLPAGVADLVATQGDPWKDSPGKEGYRRGLYIQYKRAVPYPFLLTFDAPTSTASCSRRARSNTPLQALNLLNDPVFLEAAVALANRIVGEAPPRFEYRLNYAYELCFARQATPSETELLKQYYERRVALLKKQPDAASAFFPAAEAGERCESAAWVGVSRLLLNLDEFVTRE